MTKITDWPCIAKAVVLRLLPVSELSMGDTTSAPKPVVNTLVHGSHCVLWTRMSKNDAPARVAGAPQLSVVRIFGGDRHSTKSIACSKEPKEPLCCTTSCMYVYRRVLPPLFKSKSRAS